MASQFTIGAVRLRGLGWCQYPCESLLVSLCLSWCFPSLLGSQFFQHFLQVQQTLSTEAEVTALKPAGLATVPVTRTSGMSTAGLDNSECSASPVPNRRQITGQGGRCGYFS